MKINKRIDIVFAIDDGYTSPMIVTAFSVIKNNTTFETIAFHVINSGLSASHVRNIKKLEKFPGVLIDFAEVDEALFHDFPSNIKHISPIAYGRFLTADLYPDLAVVLYLDSDILVRDDLGALWLGGTRGKCVAGSHKAYITKQFPGYKQSIGLHANSTYINSGVMLMNLSRIRKMGKTQQLLVNAKALKNIVRIQDQDIINVTFQGEIARFDKRYNYTDSDRREAKRNDEVSVVHFNTRNKPWVSDFQFDATNDIFAKEYMRYQHEIITRKV